MRILLLQPPKSDRTIGGEDIHVFEPLSLEYVAAGVVGDHEVELLDLRFDRDLEGTLRRLRPGVVGLTALTVQLDAVHALAAQVKAHDPAITVVVGGHHATVAPQDLRSAHIDVLVQGEGIATFAELVRRLEAGEGWHDLPGVAYERDGELVSIPDPTPVDLDALPLPARHLTARHRHRFFSQWMRPMAGVITSMGCPFRCSYCAIWKLTGGKRLTRDTEALVEEIRGLDEDWVFFADYESLIEVDRMRHLAQRLREEGIRKRYSLYGRADTIASHPDLLELWRDVGLDLVIVGFEFFRDEDLADVNKNTTTADNERAIEVLQDLGINIGAYFLVKPEFDDDDFEQMRRYVVGLKLRFASFFVLTPLPGTDLHDERCGELTSTDPALYDFFHAVLPTKLPLPRFYEQMYRSYRAPISLASALSLLRNFRLLEVPGAILRTRRVLNKLRRAHLDHDRPPQLEDGSRGDRR